MMPKMSAIRLRDWAMVRQLCEAGQLDYARVGGQRGWMRVYRDSIDEYAKRNNIRLKWDAIDSGKK